MTLEDRIRAVQNDVASRVDKYRDRNVHELARLLGIDASSPDDKCSYWAIVEPIDLARIAAESDEIHERWIYELESHVSKERFAHLLGVAERAGSFDFDVSTLDTRESQTISEWIAAERLSEPDQHILLALFTIFGAEDEALQFEGRVEDDGSIVDLLGPYDQRDGLFVSMGESAASDSW